MNIVECVEYRCSSEWAIPAAEGLYIYQYGSGASDYYIHLSGRVLYLSEMETVEFTRIRSHVDTFSNYTGWSRWYPSSLASIHIPRIARRAGLHFEDVEYWDLI